MDNRLAQPRRGTLAVFWLLTFGISWAAWIPMALASRGLGAALLPPGPSSLLGAWGPALAALACAAAFEGAAGVRALGARLIRWRLRLRWYALALLLPPALALGELGIGMLLGGAAPDFEVLPFHRYHPLARNAGDAPLLALVAALFVQQTVLGSSMGEEPGWRGWALPRLQTRHGALVASLIIGAGWWAWHLPLWFTAGHPMGGWGSLQALPGLIASAVLFTWIFNHTHGSLVPALLYHSAMAMSSLFLPESTGPAAVGPALSLAVAGMVVWRAGSRLGLHASVPEPGADTKTAAGAALTGGDRRPGAADLPVGGA